MKGKSPHVFMPPAAENALEFLVSGSLPHQATFARRSTFAETGLFDTSYRSHADYDWFLKVATKPQDPDGDCTRRRCVFPSRRRLKRH